MAKKRDRIDLNSLSKYAVLSISVTDFQTGRNRRLRKKYSTFASGLRLKSYVDSERYPICRVIDSWSADQKSCGLG